MTSSESLLWAGVPSKLKQEPLGELDLNHSLDGFAKVIAEAAGSIGARPLD